MRKTLFRAAAYGRERIGELYLNINFAATETEAVKKLEEFGQ